MAGRTCAIPEPEFVRNLGKCYAVNHAKCGFDGINQVYLKVRKRCAKGVNG